MNEQRAIINRQRGRIRELEEYIDQLLVRVIATQPELLQSVAIEDSKKRAGSATHNANRSSFSFNWGK